MRQAQTTLALGLLLASTVAMAAGQPVQKQRVTARSVERPLGSRGRGFSLLLARLARDPVWLLDHLCALAGALFGLQAMASLDLLVLKSFGRLKTLFVVLGGAWFLGERLRPDEWLGVAAMFAGATVLSVVRQGAIRTRDPQLRRSEAIPGISVGYGAEVTRGRRGVVELCIVRAAP